ncbi:tyrosine-type recombinase/integrase [Mesorhizobium sp.]|uniref:tyrosine-type recombinase/integrase n=1 Tax=Mesorhizobium sp. TaxID=1871066 RepID=UPI00257ADEF5|nr:tyrosine-type recombinase/integrase [Mesorhizobium sp.]
MLKAIPKAATVDRYLNVVRAIIAHRIREFDLVGVKNQFEKLDVADSGREPDKRKRLPFTAEQLAATRERVLDRAADDLKQIWRLLQGTGCRLSEITGLRVSDVMLEAQYPHIDVEWHDERRVKTEVSRRKVPLIGDDEKSLSNMICHKSHLGRCNPLRTNPKPREKANSYS